MKTWQKRLTRKQRRRWDGKVRVTLYPSFWSKLGAEAMRALRTSGTVRVDLRGGMETDYGRVFDASDITFDAMPSTPAEFITVIR